MRLHGSGQGFDGAAAARLAAGYEAGRLAVAAATCSSSAQVGLGHSGYHLAPVVAKAAADLLKGGGCADVDLELLGLGRAAVEGSSSWAQQAGGGAAAVDTWEGLWQLQRRPQDAMSEEERQDLAADARSDAREARLSGTQFFNL